ncbi:MAG: hypothetical protein EHM54_05280 [Nitrospiraceae bacterium]|jgi:Domain of unknown function (DUF6485)|nr:MAG: hypothetical protein EHM54_05280 [Nitrospiraceae bacterium]
MECISEKNKAHCNCTYEPCPRKYKCCECLQYHRKSDELPACYFNREFEKTYDRSLDNFLRMRQR